MTRQVSLVDVTLRDGLQEEHKLVATTEKLRLARALADAGVERVEATSFVSPKWVPQLADAEALVEGWPGIDMRPAALIMNVRGFERARAAFTRAGFAEGSYDLVFVVSASAQHNRSNNNRTTAETLALFDEVARQRGGVSLHGAIACAFASPYEGEAIVESEVVSIAERLMKGGVAHFSVCDTVGTATPALVATRVGAVHAGTGHMPTLHLHDLAGRAVPNVLAGLEAGVTVFEGVLGGIGGCPFAPGAPGNFDLVKLHDLLTGAGCSTGLDRERLVAAAGVLHDVLAGAAPLVVADTAS